jgi:hypothetical protein
VDVQCFHYGDVIFRVEESSYIVVLNLDELKILSLVRADAGTWVALWNCAKVGWKDSR